MSAGGESPARVVDVRGEYCPQPIIETARAVKEIAVGEVVLVLGTDRGIHTDMPAWCRATRHELVEISEADGIISARVRRSR